MTKSYFAGEQGIIINGRPKLILSLKNDRTQLFDSVAPEVKNISSGSAPSVSAITSRAFYIAILASCPKE